MSSYFDKEKTDSIATEYGLLERRRKEGDFYKEDNGAFFLNKEALKRYLEFYEERMEKLFLYREKDAKTSYRKLFRMQVERLEKAVLNREEYQPFLVR
jgi:CRISPR-associated protein Cas1